MRQRRRRQQQQRDEGEQQRQTAPHVPRLESCELWMRRWVLAERGSADSERTVAGWYWLRAAQQHGWCGEQLRPTAEHSLSRIAHLVALPRRCR